MALWGSLFERAMAIAPPGPSLTDVRHVVMLMQENRSFA
jgi:phospholipase C